MAIELSEAALQALRYLRFCPNWKWQNFGLCATHSPGSREANGPSFALFGRAARARLGRPSVQSLHVLLRRH